VASPLGRAIKLAASPSGRKAIQQAVRVARTDEGRKLMAQAQRVARSPEGRKLIEQALSAAKATGKTAQSAESKERLAALRSLLLKRKR
jgi:hypothetical protein